MAVKGCGVFCIRGQGSDKVNSNNGNNNNVGFENIRGRVVLGQNSIGGRVGLPFYYQGGRAAERGGKELEGQGREENRGRVGVVVVLLIGVGETFRVLIGVGQDCHQYYFNRGRQEWNYYQGVGQTNYNRGQDNPIHDKGVGYGGSRCAGQLDQSLYPEVLDVTKF